MAITKAYEIGDFGVSLNVNSDGEVVSLDLDTDNVTEGSGNLYYTDTRARNAISVTGNLTYNSATGELGFTMPSTIASLSNHNTDALIEGTTNLYFTSARARAAITGGTGITYSSSTGQIELTSSGVTAQSYGSASQVPVITVDTYGRITSASTTAVAGVSSTDYNTSTGVLTINTSDGGSFTEDLGVGTGDSPSFANTYIGSILTVGSTAGGSNRGVKITSNGEISQEATDGAYLHIQRYSPGRVAIGANGSADLYVYNDLDVAGNITVTGTVDGRDIATDGTKLDGIESGATADQTKADIDALGINAATLDSLDSTQFLRSDADDVYAGTLTLSSGSNTKDAIVINGNGGNNFIHMIGNQGQTSFKMYENGGDDPAYFQMFNAGNIQHSFESVAGGSIVFNEQGLDINFRVEGSGEANALFVEGSSGSVGIGTGTPAGVLDVRGTSLIGPVGRQSIMSESVGNDSALIYSASGNLELRGTDTDYYHLYLKNGGNVGIGTKNPLGLLHVSSGTSGDAIVIIEADTDNNNEADSPILVFRQDGAINYTKVGVVGNAGDIYTNSTDNASYIGNEQNVPLEFFTNNTRRAYITPAGTLVAEGSMFVQDGASAAGLMALNVNGDIYLGDNSGSTFGLYCGGSTAMGSDGDVFIVGDANTSSPNNSQVVMIGFGNTANTNYDTDRSAPLQALSAPAQSTASFYSDRMRFHKTLIIDPKTSPTTTSEGAMYYDSNDNCVKFYNGSAWVPLTGVINRYSYTATASQTTFNATYSGTNVDVFLNGIKLVANTDFTASNGTSIVLTAGADAGDLVDIIAQTSSYAESSAVPSTGGSFTGTVNFDGASTNINVGNTVSASSLRLSNTGDLTPSSTGHAFQIGPDSAANIAMDNNEIMGRDNGSTTNLNLNPDGGDVTISNNGYVGNKLVVNGKIRGGNEAVSDASTVGSALNISGAAVISDTTNGGRLRLRGQDPSLWFDITDGGQSKVFYENNLELRSGYPDFSDAGVATGSSTTRAILSNDGRWSVPAQPAFEMIKTTDTTGTANANNYIRYDIVQFETGGSGCSTSTGVYTAPADGLYHFAITFTVTGGSGTGDDSIGVGFVIANNSAYYNQDYSPNLGHRINPVYDTSGTGIEHTYSFQKTVRLQQGGTVGFYVRDWDNASTILQHAEFSGHKFA